MIKNCANKNGGGFGPAATIAGAALLPASGRTMATTTTTRRIAWLIVQAIAALSGPAGPFNPWDIQGF
jgi:hypothetical protein